MTFLGLYFSKWDAEDAANEMRAAPEVYGKVRIIKRSVRAFNVAREVWCIGAECPPLPVLS